MDVPFAPEMEKKLTDLAAETGLSAHELVQNVVSGYIEELADMRDRLERRYDDLATGRITPISGDDVEAHFREKSAAARSSQPGS